MRTYVFTLYTSHTFQVKRFYVTTKQQQQSLEIRVPAISDACQIWQLVTESGVLDVNSAYLYLLLCRDFRDTCLVACRDESIVGFVTGYRLPHNPTVLFVWQIGVSPKVRRQGVGAQLLTELIKRCGAQAVTTIEATIAPTNVASRRLFESVAQQLDLPFTDLPTQGFAVDDFPPGHEAEPRIQIGPLKLADCEAV